MAVVPTALRDRQCVARVIPTYNSLSSSILLAWLQSSSSNPTTNTTGNSSPLLLCNVVSLTLGGPDGARRSSLRGEHATLARSNGCTHGVKAAPSRRKHRNVSRCAPLGDELCNGTRNVGRFLQSALETLESRQRPAAAGRLRNDQRHVFFGTAVVQDALRAFHRKRQDFRRVAVIDFEYFGAALCLDPQFGETQFPAGLLRNF
jgi:hypothetical protein